MLRARINKRYKNINQRFFCAIVSLEGKVLYISWYNLRVVCHPKMLGRWRLSKLFVFRVTSFGVRYRWSRVCRFFGILLPCFLSRYMPRFLSNPAVLRSPQEGGVLGGDRTQHGRQIHGREDVGAPLYHGTGQTWTPTAFRCETVRPRMTYFVFSRCVCRNLEHHVKTPWM